MSLGPVPSDHDDALNAAQNADAPIENPEDLPFGYADSASQPTDLPVPPPLFLVVCKRCGKQVPDRLPRCPFCDARLPVSSGVQARGDSAALEVNIAPLLPISSNVAVTRLLVFYVLMLSTNLIGVWIARGMHLEHLPDKAIAERTLPLMIFV
jgi:hypothetical protein